MHDTARFDLARAQTAALEALLASPDPSPMPDGPDPEGAWGRCYTQWYLRLDASYDVISEHPGPLAVPARFLDRINSPEALTRYLRSVAVSDIAAEGVDHRRELNYAVSALMRLILHDEPAGYPWAPGLKTTMRQLLVDELRDPVSAVWGPRYPARRRDRLRAGHQHHVSRRQIPARRGARLAQGHRDAACHAGAALPARLAADARLPGARPVRRGQPCPSRLAARGRGAAVPHRGPRWATCSTGASPPRCGRTAA